MRFSTFSKVVLAAIQVGIVSGSVFTARQDTGTTVQACVTTDAAAGCASGATCIAPSADSVLPNDLGVCSANADATFAGFLGCTLDAQCAGQTILGLPATTCETVLGLLGAIPGVSNILDLLELVPGLSTVLLNVPGICLPNLGGL